MRIIKTILGIICALFLIMVGVLLTVNNQQIVSIDLVFLQSPDASLASWLIASFMLGAVISLVTATVAMLALKSRLRRTKKQLDRSTKELDKLRTQNLNANA